MGSVRGGYEMPIIANLFESCNIQKEEAAEVVSALNYIQERSNGGLSDTGRICFWDVVIALSHPHKLRMTVEQATYVP